VSRTGLDGPGLGRQRLGAGFGERVHVSAAAVRVPLSSLLLVWLLRRLVAGLVWLFRHPLVVLGAAAGYWLLLLTRNVGPLPVLALAGSLLVGLSGWRLIGPASFERLLGGRARGRWRSVTVYGRRWEPATVTARLSLTSDGVVRPPGLRGVSSTGCVDVVRVRMLPGQTVTDWVDAGPRLAQTFGVLDVRVRSVTGRVHEVDLWCLRSDPLTAPVPVPARPTKGADVDLEAVPVGRREDGGTFTLRVLYTHLLVAGETGAGKGSVIWALLCGLAPAIQQGRVQVWAVDPKGGMELAFGAPLFARFLYGGPRDGTCEPGGTQGPATVVWQESTADLLEDAVRLMQARATRCRGVVRKHTPTTDEPLVLVVVDEIAALTAYVTDTAVRKRLAAALSLLLSQGRAVGVSVVAATQDARKEVLGMRDLFPTRVALRAAEAEQADMVLGHGARGRGARTDAISPSMPGVGYVALDGEPEPVRVRFAHVTDEHIAAVVARYGAGPAGVLALTTATAGALGATSSEPSAADLLGVAS